MGNSCHYILISNKSKLLISLIHQFLEESGEVHAIESYQALAQVTIPEKSRVFFLQTSPLRQQDYELAGAFMNSHHLKNRAAFVFLCSEHHIDTHALAKMNWLFFVLNPPFPIRKLQPALHHLDQVLDLMQKLESNVLVREREIVHYVKKEKSALYQNLSIALHHELRNAMTAVYAGSQILTQYSPDDHLVLSRRVNKLFETSSQLKQIVDNLSSLLDEHTDDILNVAVKEIATTQF